MEVAIDARSFSTGLGTYTFHLLAGLQKSEGLEVRGIVSAESAELFGPFCKSMRVVTAPIYTFREQIEVPFAAHGCDLLHVPHYNVPLGHRGPLVATIHDLTHLLDENYAHSARSRFYARPMFKYVSSRAEHIFTVSEYSKRCIVEKLGVDPSRITVVYCGVSPEFRVMDRGRARFEIEEQLQVPSPFLLFVGNLKPHKNLTALLLAFHGLVQSGYKHRLVLVGDDRRHKSTICSLIKKLNLESRVKIIAHIAGNLLAKLYNAAEVLILPSFEEGFGLPIIEAMACGTPVVCSRAGSLPEVGGDAAEYFEPRSHEELRITLQRVLDSIEVHRDMSRKGLERSAQFRWENFVVRHYQVYKSFS